MLLGGICPVRSGMSNSFYTVGHIQLTLSLSGLDQKLPFHPFSQWTEV